uniref:Uncharacterized protein n=1 Tax=Rhipicephalus zambeziensis TaxID=60191 RepID=A0A224YG82_9ACAR
MAWQQSRRHRRYSSRFEDVDASTQPSFRQARSGGGDGDFPEWQDLRQKLNFMRSHRQDLSQRKPEDAHDTQPNSSKHTDTDVTRGSEIAAAIEIECACSVNVEENEQDEGTPRETVQQISPDEVHSRGTAGKKRHSSVRHQPQQMHHEYALTTDNPKSIRAQSFCFSEEQETPKTDAAVAEKHCPFKSQGDYKYAVRNTEEENVLEQSNVDEEQHNVVPETRNDDRVTHSKRPRSPSPNPVDQDRTPLQCRDNSEYSYAAMQPHIDTEVTGLNKEGLEELKNVPTTRGKNCQRWRGSGGSDAENMDHQYQHCLSPRRRTRAQAMASMSADADSDDSEHNAKRSKLQCLEEGHRPDHSCAGLQTIDCQLSSEAPPEDQRKMQDLMERFQGIMKVSLTPTASAECRE